MKQAIITLLLITYLTGIVSSDCYCQAFIRVYNHYGQKIGKGSIEFIGDSVLVIANGKNPSQEFSVRQISFIKTKRTVASSMLTGFGVGAFISVSVGKRIMDASDKTEKFWDAMEIGMLSGVAAGTLIGLVSGLAMKRQKFVISGDMQKWNAVKDQLLALSAND